MERSVNYDKNCDLNLKATELRLGLPGGDEEHEASTINRSNKRASSEISSTDASSNANQVVGARPPPPKAQVVGWPPVQSHRKNCFQQKKTEGEGLGMYVKVSVDGAPFLRKIDLKVYGSYKELLKALENMFKLTIGSYSEREGYNGSEYAPTYEDKDGDWMLVGDVPWEMFTSTCKRLRIMKGSEARGFLCA